MLHHASMQFYKDYLTQKGHKVTYIDHASYNGMEAFFKRVLENEVQVIHVCDPVDFLLKKRLIRFAERYNKQLVWYSNPNFLNSKSRNEELLAGKKKYFLADFYKQQRLHYNILIQGGKPEGGQWSFDTENRKSLPKNVQTGLTNYGPKTKSYQDSLAIFRQYANKEMMNELNFYGSLNRRSPATAASSLLED
jgi:deoxyribodipyrimidine photolyase-related protein